MFLKGLGRRLLLIWVLSMVAIVLLYTAELASEPKYLLLGVFVAQT
jgi:hypothetical protein